MQSVERLLSREAFGELVESLRPELHRYCARMTGSVTDGEDIVQDVLVRAHAALGELEQVSELKPWLFRVAHNRAIDHGRGYAQRMLDPLEALEGRPEAQDGAPAADERLAREEILRLAVSRFGELPPLQRSCVILKDVLDHSLQDIAALLELGVPAVQAALHRGRARLQRLATSAPSAPTLSRRISPALARYAELFRARDWDGVRALLADDVRLDVVSRLKKEGRGEVSSYFTNYARLPGWRLEPGWVEGQEALLGFREGEPAVPSYFVQVWFSGDRVLSIRDFLHVPYIARDASWELA